MKTVSAYLELLFRTATVALLILLTAIPLVAVASFLLAVVVGISYVVFGWTWEWFV